MEVGGSADGGADITQENLRLDESDHEIRISKGANRCHHDRCRDGLADTTAGAH